MGRQGRCGKPVLLLLILVLRTGHSEDSTVAADSQTIPRTTRSGADSGPVVLRLKETMMVAAPRVYISDVAHLEGGQPQFRERMATLDLTNVPLSGRVAAIPRLQISYRLQLAGIPAEKFRLEGAQAVKLYLSRPMGLAEFVEAAARQVLLQRLPAGKEDVAIQVLQPTRAPSVASNNPDRIQVEAEARQSIQVPGIARIEVRVLVDGVRLASVPVIFNLKVYERIPVARGAIEKGQPLTDQNVNWERRVRQGRYTPATSPEGVLGKEASRSLSAGEVIRVSDVQSLSNENPLVVRARDVVRLVIRLGDVEVSTMAEALQGGRVGEMIRVRNVDSKKVVVGRVINRSVVEIGL